MIIALSALAAVIISAVIISVCCFIIAEKRKVSFDFNDDEHLNGTRWEKYKGLIREGLDWYYSMPFEEVEILSRDNLRLRGRYIACGGEKTVILFHGYRSAAHNDFSTIVKFYYENGYNMLLPDQRAHGKSMGKYIGFGALERYDCISWIDYINERFDFPPILLAGISMGASTVLMASGVGLPKNVRGIVADCGFTSPADIISKVLKEDYKLPKFPFYYISNALSKILAGYSYGECSAEDALKHSEIPLIIFHGSEDPFVPCEMSGRIFNASAAKTKELYIVDGALHAESYAKEPYIYQERLKRFFDVVM